MAPGKRRWLIKGTRDSSGTEGKIRRREARKGRRGGGGTSCLRCVQHLWCVYVLYGCRDAQTPGAWCGKLARVDVGNLPHGGIHVVQVLALHHQDRLGWVKVEL